MDADAPSRYPQAYAAWKADPSAFWAEAAREIDWFKPAEKVFDPNAGVYGRWFVGAECNTCHNAVDRHVAAGGASRRRSSTTPRHRNEAHASPTPSCWTRSRLSAAVLQGWASKRATGSSSTCR